MAESLVWVEVPCPLCGAQCDEPILSTATAHGPCRLVRCGHCDMVYLNPRPSDDSLHLLYPDDYEDYQPEPPREKRGVVRSLRKLALAHYEGYPPGPRTGLQRALAPVGKALLDWHGETMTRIPWVGQGRLLDYGCGSGWFGARMREQGWNVTVMDFNAKSVGRVGQRYGLRAVAGSLPHPDLPPESFDVVTMGCVLEHVPQPHRVIEEVTRLLAPGGVLVVKVPHIGSWGFRTFAADWWGLQLPLHLLHFTSATLSRLLEMHGLTVQECRMVPHGNWLRRSLRTVLARTDVSRTKRLLCRTAGWSPLSRLIGWWTTRANQAEALKVLAVKPRHALPIRPSPLAAPRQMAAGRG